MEPLRNFSFRGEPIEFRLSCPYVLLIDPLALDGLSADLQVISEARLDEIPAMTHNLPGGLRIGVTEISDFSPGMHSLGNLDFEEADDEDSLSTFDIDSGAVCVIDLEHMGITSKALTWNRYDAFLRSQAGDNSIWVDIVTEVGGPFFGMLNGDVATPFRGDGTYRLKPGRPRPLSL
jgi:hypothetical protein